MCGSSSKEVWYHSPLREYFVEPSTAAKPPTFDPHLFQKLLVLKSSIILKNLPHMPGTKPMAEIIDYIPDETAAMALHGISSKISTAPSSDTNNIIKWNRGKR